MYTDAFSGVVYFILVSMERTKVFKNRFSILIIIRRIIITNTNVTGIKKREVN